jgi:hypothetical protein
VTAVATIIRCGSSVIYNVCFSKTYLLAYLCCIKIRKIQCKKKILPGSHYYYTENKQNYSSQGVQAPHANTSDEGINSAAY